MSVGEQQGGGYADEVARADDLFQMPQGAEPRVIVSLHHVYGGEVPILFTIVDFINGNEMAVSVFAHAGHVKHPDLLENGPFFRVQVQLELLPLPEKKREEVECQVSAGDEKEGFRIIIEWSQVADNLDAAHFNVLACHRYLQDAGQERNRHHRCPVQYWVFLIQFWIQEKIVGVKYAQQDSTQYELSQLAAGIGAQERVPDEEPEQ